MLNYPDVTTIIPALRDGAFSPISSLVMKNSGTYFSEIIHGIGRYNEVLAFLSTSNITGTNPTLDVKFQSSPDQKTWTDIGSSFVQSTTVTGQQLLRIYGFGRYVRAVIVLGGTTPQYTVSLTLIAKIGTIFIPQAQYNTSTPTFTPGQPVNPQFDINGNQLVSLATLIAGEDLTNNVIKTEERFTGSGVLTSDTLVKSGAGFLHAITISQNDAAPTAGTIDVIDNTSAGASPKIWTWTLTTAVFTPFTIILDVAFSTGLYVDFTTTGDVAVVCSYR